MKSHLVPISSILRNNLSSLTDDVVSHIEVSWHINIYLLFSISLLSIARLEQIHFYSISAIFHAISAISPLQIFQLKKLLSHQSSFYKYQVVVLTRSDHDLQSH